MTRQLYMAAGVLLVALQSMHAHPVSRRANIIGGGSVGARCTLQMNIDNSAEVEIWGDMAELRTLSGQDGVWQRFQCTAPMPRDPVDFRLVSVSGRGRVSLQRDPRSNFGRAVVRIDDSQGGRGGYTFELQWRGSNGPGWHPGPPPAPAPGFPPGKAIQACQDAVTGRLNQYGYPAVAFGRTNPTNNPGRNDWITGTATGRRRSGSTLFSYSCSVDFQSGRVRSVDVQRQ